MEAPKATPPDRRRRLTADSPLLGGQVAAEAGDEEALRLRPAYDADADVYRLPVPRDPPPSRRPCATSRA